MLGLLCYGAVVALVTLTPNPVGPGFEHHVTGLIEIFHAKGLPTWFGFNWLEWVANVVLFIPLGMFVTLLLPQRLQWVALIVLPLISVAIETTQHLFFPARFATVEDVLGNSIGGAIGVLIAWLLRVAVHRRDAKRH